MKHPLLVVALALCPLAACSAPGAGSSAEREGPVPFESVARQPQSGLQEAERTVIRTGPEWEAAWKRINAYRMPAPPAPAVDFSRDMVVLIALGQRSSAGYGVKVDAVERTGGFLRVHAREEGPGPDEVTAAVLTHPFQAVRVPRSDGPVEVVVE